jgi:Sulfotransferase domain
MAAPNDFITIVSGLPRSGTSLMMQMLNAGGLPALTDEKRAADESNPRGYFEFEPVKTLRANQAWLAGARGRAVKIIHILLRELPTDGRFTYRVILMKRSLEEILASQRAMLQRQGKKSADEAALRKIFQQQLLETESYLATHPQFSLLSIDYHDVVESPLTCAKKVQSFLDRDLNAEAMARVVDPALYRERL